MALLKDYNNKCNFPYDFKLLVLCCVLLLGGCRQKTGERSEAGSEKNGDSKESVLYQNSVFTEPFGFPEGIEGPAVDADGTLYAVNFKKPGTIGRVDAEGNASLFVTLPEGSTGNGIRFNSSGHMLIADYTMHNILKVDMDSKEVSVYAHNDQMNQPNDIAIMDNDILFASDPDWDNSRGQIWRIDTDGAFTLLEGDMGTTNGIEVSPDNKTLYVNESVQRNIWAYDLSPEGDISNKRLLIKFDDFGMDGMRTDADGNLYVARYGKGTVVKVSPQGEVLKEIRLKGKKVSNIAFGGKDGTRAFLTLQDNGNIETFSTERPGRAYQMMKKNKE
ncbi:SMP-30/gluconolactonase/LRE family protein [Sinomicrobium sp. FJxs]|uniref:SMP-30/gluconolactonase/LRE family protein n=2 Tax=Sinomicrobium weinanense TaxID=2842200 RepID=A0A926JUW0_9FLAO|nr:SMP-30/gluconolactonase/LRE family protein [Sinomicrobium weinanense]MBU3125496.1 SMP-30/gluconolactonase/LRE family protein [Sinomicrobium weinanense]